MKKELFKIFKIFAFLSVVLVLITILSGAVDTENSKAGIDKVDKVMLEFGKEEENTIDVVVLGDSEAYRSIIPLEMYREYGFTTYIVASPEQKMYQSGEILNKVLETQRPKLCILDVNLIFRNFSAFEPYEHQMETAFPIFKYHNGWKSIVDPDYSYDDIGEKSYKGYRLNKKVKGIKNVFFEPTQDARKISSKNLSYFDEVVEICKKNDIELLLLSTPSAKNWDYSKHNALEQLAKDKDLNYIDLNTVESISIDWSKDTFDRGDHLNYSGACKVTKYLQKYLNDNYDLTDHREDENYNSWDEAAESFFKKVK